MGESKFRSVHTYTRTWKARYGICNIVYSQLDECLICIFKWICCNVVKLNNNMKKINNICSYTQGKEKTIYIRLIA